MMDSQRRPEDQRMAAECTLTRSRKPEWKFRLRSRVVRRSDAHKTYSRLSLLSHDAGATAIEPYGVQAGGRPLDDRALQLGALGQGRSTGRTQFDYAGQT